MDPLPEGGGRKILTILVFLVQLAWIPLLTESDGGGPKYPGLGYS